MKQLKSFTPQNLNATRIKMNNKTFEERKKIYDLWHKDVYQTNIQEHSKRAEKLHNQIIKHLKINRATKGSFLDIACGKGLFLSFLKKLNKNLNLYGSDISEYAISQSKKIVNAKLNVADGEHLPCKDNFFDYCSCLGGLEYYPNPQIGVREISRVLKPKGKAVIFVPNLMFLGYIWLALRYGLMPTHGGTAKNKTYYDYSDEKFFTYKGWTNILEKNGLKIIQASSFNYLGRTEFISPFLLKIYDLFLNKFIPFNLSYCFIFVCIKNE